MKLPLDIISEEIIQKHNLRKLSHKGLVYMDIQKWMYRLPQSIEVANDKLKINMAKFGYYPEPISLGLWRHRKSPLQFSLVLDDFGVKYEHQEEITHLLDALKSIYKML